MNRTSPHLRSYVTLILWIAVYLGAGSLIGQVTRESIPGWYETLTKPPLNPPNLVFPIVWTTLYLMMAVAGWRLSRHLGTTEGKLCMVIFLLQTIVNWAWSFLFFEWHLLGISFLWILLLIALVASLIYRVRNIDSTVAWLLMPYLAWIAFASYLNGSIWALN